MPDTTYDYLDYDGLALYDEKIKQLIDAKQDAESGKGLSANDYTTTEKNKLANIAAGAEVNQNAFSTVSVAGTSLAADSKTDTLTITAGDNVTLTPTASSDSFTIAATDTTYPEATSTKGGVLTDAQAVKLNGIAAGAEVNQNAFSTIAVGSTSIAADSKTDTLTITAGDNVTLTPNANDDSITIAATDTTDLTQMTGVLPVSKGGTGNNVYTGDGLVRLGGNNNAMTVATPSQIVSDIGNTAVNRATADASGNNIAETYAQKTELPSASSTTPKMDGTATVGSETAYAKGDHIHPTDTSRAPLASPTFTGTPKAPTATAGTNTTQIATTAFVGTAVANAISGIQGISYEVVASLPATGEAGVIYLVSNSGSAPNIYDEYIWTGTAFEKIGTTDVDLSGYQPLMTAITNAQINALFT